MKRPNVSPQAMLKRMWNPHLPKSEFGQYGPHYEPYLPHDHYKAGFGYYGFPYGKIEQVPHKD
jgi:hypothetical protein